MFEVIIPVKNRSEIKQCVDSLINPENVRDRVYNNSPKRVIICDGGSSDRPCISALQELQKRDTVEILSYPSSQFNKSRLINQGILHSHGEYLLISDADIIWNAETLTKLLDRVKLQEKAIACVQNVAESNPAAEVLKRDRYTYKIAVENNIPLVKIVREENNISENRPGCGLICTRKSTLIALGGYKEIFQGWGWEDRDLLMRAELLGFEICWTGKVIHLSHSDNVRNQSNDRSIMTTRNLNIIASLHSLQKSAIGDLGKYQIRKHPELFKNRK
ncbi:glycosyltransferase family 2 protein [Spirulina sp. 06S082]|uniref:glycosyltransferase family 2 protein n=1 Tax=Spirulina sp. 06S082 TaxID=3110248 RepID=UPI002B1EF91B|nr:glycosyltransferase [Spirulina sp. 06S082]MEA5468129.1 glycosyltransferase [Spirulina sp. 06S082]